jgi:hypothetical protein
MSADTRLSSKVSAMRRFRRPPSLRQSN